jgi:CRP/FNR family transcriptional regulator, cyclic AMP receptor protein
MSLPQYVDTTEEAVRRIAALADLPPAARAHLASIGRVRNYPVGTVLFNEGDQHDTLYFVCRGTVNLAMRTSSGPSQTILTVGCGELLAWSALVGNRIMTATAVAAEPLECLEFAGSQLQRQLEEDPCLGYRMMSIVARSLSRRLLATRLQLLDLYQS